MLQHIKQFWATHLWILAWLIIFFDPSVEKYALAHSNISGTVMLVWGVLLHWAQSPFAKKS